MQEQDNLMPTVRYCISRKGRLHARKNQDGEYYCRLSYMHYDENYCPYLGDPVIVMEKGKNYCSWKRYLKCKLVPEDDLLLKSD